MSNDKELQNEARIENSKIKTSKALKTIKKESIEKEEEIKDLHISSVPQVKSVTILGALVDELSKYSKDAIPREAIGLLGGKELRTNELVITNILFVTEGDEVSVSFSNEDFKAFEEILENDGYCLGWWHSHPGYGLFLSQTDIETHIFSFQLHNALSVALVIEPTKIDMNGRAAFKFYQVVRDQGVDSYRYQEVASYIQK
ncbi:MAG: Mov34/MPN/PAD-1 family protein [Candidatus Hodarchaeota archaeon]